MRSASGLRRLLVLLGLFTLWIAPLLSWARFEPGTIHLGGGLGIRGSSEGTIFSLAAEAGVFVFKGFDLSLSTVFQTGGDNPSHLMIHGAARWIIVPDLVLSPYLTGGGGRLFIEGDDAWIASVGGGLLNLFDSFGIDIGVGYRWFFFPGIDPIGSYYLQLGLLFWF